MTSCLHGNPNFVNEKQVINFAWYKLVSICTFNCACIFQHIYGFYTDDEFECWVKFSNSPIRPSFSPITPPPLPRSMLVNFIIYLFIYWFPHNNKFCSVEECVESLRQDNGIEIPTTDDAWCEIDRTYIVVRRKELVQDAIKEGKKKRFSPSKLTNVSIKLLVYNIFRCWQHSSGTHLIYYCDTWSWS